MNYITGFLNGFWEQLQKGQVVRRIAFFWMIWMTTKIYFWSLDYISNIETVTTEHGMLLAAILTPITALQGAVIKFYAQHPFERGES
jgi:hypothetical protein